MPALPEEKEHALEEGVKIYDYIAPVEVICDKQGVMESLKCIRMKKGEFDDTARRKPVPIEGSEFCMDGDTLLIAIGAQGEVEQYKEIKTKMGKTIIVDPETMATSVKGVFAWGDCIHGPDTVIRAIADGRKAALSIDRFLGGSQIEIEMEQRQSKRSLFASIIEQERCRMQVPVLDPEERTKGFQEIELPFDEQACQQEALRCLRCDVK